MLQFEGSEPLTNSILGQRQRPTSDINNSSSISPAHPKVTRSISANQKQRRYSDHGGDDDGGGGGVVEKPSKVTSSFPALSVLLAACCVCVGGGDRSDSSMSTLLGCASERKIKPKNLHILLLGWQLESQADWFV